MPPSLSVSVGVPFATVTASLRLTVSVTRWPASRSPEPVVMPIPDVVTDETVGVCINLQPGKRRHCSGEIGRIAPASFTVAEPRLTAVTAKSGVFCPAATV